MVNIRLRKGGLVLNILLATAVGAAVGSTLLVYTRTELLSLRYRLNSLRQLEGYLRSEVEKLRLEAAILAAPESLEDRARELGLAYPKDGQVVQLPNVATGTADGVDR